MNEERGKRLNNSGFGFNYSINYIHKYYFIITIEYKQIYSHQQILMYIYRGQIEFMHN
jgi:hypothetical protein